MPHSRHCCLACGSARWRGELYPRAPACPVLDHIADHGIATLIRMYGIARRDLACPDVRCGHEIKHIKVRNPQTSAEGSKVIRQMTDPSIDGDVTDRQWAHHQRRAPRATAAVKMASAFVSARPGA